MQFVETIDVDVNERADERVDGSLAPSGVRVGLVTVLLAILAAGVEFGCGMAADPLALGTVGASAVVNGFAVVLCLYLL